MGSRDSLSAFGLAAAAAEPQALRYAAPAVVLHWVLVAVVLVQIGLGWYMTGLPAAERSWWFGLHKSLGLTAALLVAARVAWRLTHLPPPMPAWLPAWQARAAALNHRLLYACMIVMPVAGYVSAEFYKYPTRFWGYRLPDWGWESELLNSIFSGIHAYTSYLFVLLIALHVAAGLRHYLRGDGIFERIAWRRARR